jgi:hypothetical protein
MLVLQLEDESGTAGSNAIGTQTGGSIVSPQDKAEQARHGAIMA